MNIVNFKHLGHAVKAVLACGVVGVLYGAVAGAAFGTVFAPIAGTIFGFFFGAAGGAIFGLMGGSIGGPLGWGFAGCVGGLVSSSLLNSGRPHDAFALAPAHLGHNWSLPQFCSSPWETAPAAYSLAEGNSGRRGFLAWAARCACIGGPSCRTLGRQHFARKVHGTARAIRVHHG